MSASLNERLCGKQRRRYSRIFERSSEGNAWWRMYELIISSFELYSRDDASASVTNEVSDATKKP